MKKTKQLITLVAFMISVFMNAETIGSGTCGDNATWRLEDDGTLYIEGSGEMKDYSSSGNSVSPWYSKRTSVKIVEISEGITYIGHYAFYACANITSVTIPNSVTNIGSYSFFDCTNLPVENNIRYADTYLVGVADKTLSEYTIKEGTKFIGENAFKDCTSLTYVNIPNSVTSIGNSAFYNCIYEA